MTELNKCHCGNSKESSQVECDECKWGNGNTD